MVEPANHRDNEKNENNNPAVHPVDEDEYEDGRAADSPKFPEEDCEEATEGLGGAEPHVSIRGEHRGRHTIYLLGRGGRRGRGEEGEGGRGGGGKRGREGGEGGREGGRGGGRE